MRNSRRFRLATAVGGVLTLWANLASAQTKPAEAISELVVTAQKRSEDVQKVPISIQAFSGKDIAKLGVKSSSDLGQITPNVDIALPAGAGNQPIGRTSGRTSSISRTVRP